VNSLQYGYGTVSESPQRQRASEELGFFCEKNIYKQLAQLATARGATATETKNIAHVFYFWLCLLAVCSLFTQMQNELWGYTRSTKKLIYKNNNKATSATGEE